MPLTIREALNFGGLFGASVVAGESGLDTQIESVSVLEVAESRISRWTLKNQLYITSFYAIYDNVEQQKEVIQTLISNGCCGLVLCYVGTWIQQIDLNIIQLCNEVGFPLIQARTDVSYIEILNPIINLLYEENTQAEDIDDYSMTRNDLLNVIVNEENTDEVFKQMNQRLEKKISYFDTYGKIIFSDREDEMIQAEKEYLKENFNHVLYACSKNGYTVKEILGIKSLIVLIRSKKNLFGIFITDYTQENSPEMNKDFINSLVLSGALVLRRRNRMADFREKAIEEYVTDLLIWNFPSDEKALERGKELGLHILDKNYLVLININSIQQMEMSKVQQEIQDYVKRVIMPQIEQLIKSYHNLNWMALRSDTIILFINNRNFKMNMKHFGSRLVKIFFKNVNLSISIGISNSYNSIRELSVAYLQSFNAAVIGREYYGENKVIFYDTVYFFEELRKLGAKSRTQEICHNFLRPIQEYDEANDTELIRTLKCLITNQENTLKTARQMYVHKNTILQRKSKIVELLGYSPFETPNILNFLIIFDILK